ncbi:Helicase (fragment) [Bosea sp. 125]
MVPVTVFQIDGAFGVLPSDEIDAADELRVIHEFDPHDCRPPH